MENSDAFYWFQPVKADREWLYINEYSPELEKELSHRKPTHIVIKHLDLKDLKFLSGLESQILQLWVEEDSIEDISFVSSLVALEDLSVRGDYRQIDFTQLRSLKGCAIESRQTGGNISRCSNLEELTLSVCPFSDLTPLAGLKRLRVLNLQEMPLKTLRGIENLSALQFLAFVQVDLENLSGIESLKHLQ